MKWNKIGRFSMALVASAALALGMSGCGGGTIGYMWALGTTSTATSAGQIAGFKIDNYTGNLTTIPRSPFASGGSNPVQIVVKAGGRYVYVINQGTFVNNGSSTARDGNIAEFSVGGDGTLTFQQSYNSQGQTPVWAATDNGGNFLYVLDGISPAPAGSPYFGLGDITVFSIAADTGRLTLVTNSQVRDPTTNINLNYFPVGPSPSMLRVTSSGCVYTLDSDETVFPYMAGTAGQLNQTVNSTIVTGGINLTSIDLGSGSNVYLTDAAVTTQFPNGSILGFTTGTNCALDAVVGSPFANVTPAETPVWTLTEARTSKFVYAANQGSTNATTPGSSISVFTIDSTNRLQMAALGTSNPSPVGSGPMCLVEDPTNQYIYSSNSIDGTISGFRINTSTGLLSPLPHGSTFKALTHLTCLAISGSVG